MGGKSSTTTQQSGPPAQYLQAYSDVLGRAQGVANQPLQTYPGQLQADFSPLQNQGFGTIGSSGGVSAPYINTAAQLFNSAAGTSLNGVVNPYTSAAGAQLQKEGSANLQGALSPYQNQAGQGFAQGSAPVNAQQYSGAALGQYMSPYTQNVINATQQQFNTQNAQAQAGLRGNAASQGALGGDRLGVAQAQLAGQQQMAQAPVIAGLQNQGFAQAQNEFNTQQQTQLGAQEASRNLALQGAQGYAGLGGQSLTAAQQQAALQGQVAQGYNQLGQTQLGAAQSQGWLNEQAAAGYAGLGNQALNSTLQSGNAMLNAGALQQQQAQQSLNIPYQQWQAQQAYPFQTTGWLSNIAQGLGGASGGTSSTTQPGPSGVSQVVGLGLAGAGIYGASGGFGDTAGTNYIDSGTWSNRGGAVGRASGGGVPDVSVTGLGSPNTPGATATGGFGIPDLSVSVIPGAQGMNVPATSHGTPHILAPTGSKTTSNDNSMLSGAAHLGTTLLADSFGGPGAGLAANYGLGLLGINRGGAIGRADGGPVSVSIQPGKGGFGVPQMAVNGGGAPADLTNYLAQQKAGAYRPPVALPTPAVPAAAAPGAAAPGAQGGYQGPPLPGVVQGQQISPFEQTIIDKFGGLGFPQDSGGGGNARGGAIHGFASGGAPDDDDYFLPPAQQDTGPPAPPTPSNGMTAVRDLGDISERVPQVQRQANPWLALMTAGFATAAGRSPFALENIGQGGLAGTKEYVSADQAAKQLAARVDQARAGLALSQAQGIQTGAYQQGELGLRGKQLDQTKELTLAQMAQTKALQQAELGQRLSIAKMEMGMRGAALAEERRYHDITATPQDVRDYQYFQGLSPADQSKYQDWQLARKGIQNIWADSPTAGVTAPDGTVLPPAQTDLPASPISGAMGAPGSKPQPIPTAAIAPGQNAPQTTDTPEALLGKIQDNIGNPASWNQDVLNKLAPGPRAQVIALLQGRQMFPARPNPAQMNLINAAAMVDPTYDATNYNVRAKTRADFTPSGKAGQAVTALNNAIEHTGNWSDAMDKMGNTSFTPWNTAVNAVHEWLGDPNPQSAQRWATTVSSEMRKVLATTGGGGLEELKQWERSIPTSMSSAQKERAVTDLMDILQPRLGSLSMQYATGTGTPGDRIPLLTSGAQRAYSKLTGEGAPNATTGTPIRGTPTVSSHVIPGGSAAPALPPMPPGVPPGSDYSPSRNQWRDPSGRIYPGVQ